MARTPRLSFQVQSYEAMRAMVRAGLGIALIPAPNILPYEALLGLRAVPLTDDWVHMQLNLVCMQPPAPAL
jgi:DNA-binding transcriptional LysR family regulator